MKRELIITAYSLLAGLAGTAIAYQLSFPVYLLTGPALTISLLSLLGLRFGISPWLRDSAFLLIGISIGAAVTAEAKAAFVRWPIAFLSLAIMLVAALLICRAVLSRGFGFDPRQAILAASPGHLSYVLSLGTDLKVDLTAIAVVQTIRVLALTLLVPFIALALGVKFDGEFLANVSVMPPLAIGLLVIASFLVGLVLKRLRVPAPLLIGGMLVSSLVHGAEVVEGGLPAKVTMACFIIVGTLIGSRFSGVSIQQLKRFAGAGCVTTAITISLAVLASLPVAFFLQLPVAHVLVAFAPGGLETMVAMGSVIGVNPGFLAACHVGRLFLLAALVPALVGLKRATDFENS